VKPIEAPKSAVRPMKAVITAVKQNKSSRAAEAPQPAPQKRKRTRSRRKKPAEPVRTNSEQIIQPQQQSGQLEAAEEIIHLR
ncbi:MAG: hypothetical protein WAQ57_03515, partial [Candidatus Saccharimonadales bacterium]